MEQIFPWLALIPAIVIGVVAALVVRRRGSDWLTSWLSGALLGGALYGLTLIVASLVYVNILIR